MVSTFFRLKRLGQKFRALECHDARLKELADACEALTLERTYDDFDSQKTSLALGMDDNDDYQTRKRSATEDVSELDYGDYYAWHAQHASLASQLGSRVLWLHYEDLSTDPHGVCARVWWATTRFICQESTGTPWLIKLVGGSVRMVR